MKNNIFDFSPPPWKWEKGKLGGHFMNDKNGNEIFDDGSNSGEYGSDLSKDFSDLEPSYYGVLEPKKVRKVDPAAPPLPTERR